jgi:hypothetical protein
MPQSFSDDEPELNDKVQDVHMPSPPFDLDTYEGVVADIVANLDDESKARLRSTSKEDLIQFHLSWGMGIRNNYKFWSNKKLLESCDKQRGYVGFIHPDDASVIVMQGVWEVVNARK